MAADGWTDTTIGALLASQGGSVKTGPFGTVLRAHEYSDEGVPLISVGEVGYGRFKVDDSTPRAPREVVERLPEFVLHAGDIVFGRKGAVDRSALVRPEQDGWFLGSDGIRLRLSATCNPRFVAYQLQSPETRAWLLQHATGTTMASLNQKTIERIPIRLPSRVEQAAIARILGGLDDKIELNRRANETLGTMARALFKSWFADFDPVRAKAEGRARGLPQSIADLFPDSFEDSEVGDIPSGWRVTVLGDIAEVIDCLHSKKPARKLSGLPLLQLWNIRDDGLIDMADAYLVDETDYARWISRMEARAGDCVITNVGRVGAAAQVPEGLHAALGRNMTGVRCKPSFQFPTFLIECLVSNAMRDEIRRKMDTGTILDALNVRNIPRLRLVVPPLEVARRFEGIVRPLRARMEQGVQESRTLVTLRGALLPKLISGELRVSQAERVLEGVSA